MRGNTVPKPGIATEVFPAPLTFKVAGLTQRYEATPFSTAD